MPMANGKPVARLHVGDHVIVRPGNLGEGQHLRVLCLFGGSGGDRFAGLAYWQGGSGRQAWTYATHKLARVEEVTSA